MVDPRAWLVVLSFTGACTPSADPAPQPAALQLGERGPADTPVQSASVRVTAPATLVAEEWVVPGKLLVRIHEHGLASTTNDWQRSMWTFVSEGLAPLGHQEVVVTVMQMPGEADTDYPRDLLQLYAAIHSFASKGEIATEYTITQIATSGPGLLGSPDLHIVYYAPAQLVPGVPLPDQFLTALFITPEELAQANEFGVVRFLSTLGMASGYHPFPPWNDRDRPRVQPVVGSFLNERIARGTLPGLRVAFEPGTAPVERSVAQDGGRFVLRIGPDDREEVARVLELLASGALLILLAELDREAAGVLAYAPGHADATALACTQDPVARLSANFVVLAPGDRDAAAIVEDGVGVYLSRDSWAHALETLAAEQPLEVPLEQGRTLVVEWTDTQSDAPMTSYCLR